MAFKSLINAVLGVDIKDFETKMQTATRTLKKTGRQFKRTGKSLTIGLTAPIAILGAKSVQVFAKFEQAMAKVAAVSGATEGEFKELSDTAKKLGASTRFTSEEVAQLQLAYSKLGFVPDEINKITSATLDLALATGEDLAESATVAASTLRAFQLPAEEMGRLVDVMANSFSSSALDLEKFKVAMSTVAPVANAANVSLEETTAFLSVLTDNGIEASTAGTALRNVFLELAKQGITFNEAMDKINASSNKNATSLALFGKRGATVATVLSNNVERAEELTAAYNDSGGAAKAMAKIMDATLQGSLFKLRSAVEAAAISFGESLAPTVEKIAKFFASLSQRLSEVTPSIRRTILIVAALAAAMGPLIFITGTLITNFASVLLLLPKIKLAFAALTGPVGLAIAAVVALILVLKRFNRAKKETVKETNNFVTAAKKEVAEIKGLQGVIADETIRRETRLAAVKKLRGLMPEALKNLTDEKVLAGQAAIAIDTHSQALIDNAIARGRQEKAAELGNKRATKELQLLDANIALKKIESDKRKASTQAEREGLEVKEQTIKAGNTLIQSQLDLIDEQIAAIGDLGKAAKKAAKGDGDGAGGGLAGATAKQVSESKRAAKQFARDMDIRIGAIEKARKSIGELIKATNDLEIQAFPDMEESFETTAEKLDRLLEDLGERFRGLGKAIIQTFEAVSRTLGAFFNRQEQLINNDQRVKENALDREIRQRERAIRSRMKDERVLSAALQSLEEERSRRQTKILEETESKRRKLAKRRFLLQKLAAVIEAAINTAVAVTRALKEGGIPLGIIVGALGAAQIGAIIATPVPEFAEGGLVRSPTLAVVGDNPNARVDPEIISPLSKLMPLIGGANGNGSPVIMDSRISGNDIFLTQRRQDRINKRTRR